MNLQLFIKNIRLTIAMVSMLFILSTHGLSGASSTTSDIGAGQTTDNVRYVYVDFPDTVKFDGSIYEDPTSTTRQIYEHVRDNFITYPEEEFADMFRDSFVFKMQIDVEFSAFPHFLDLGGETSLKKSNPITLDKDTPSNDLLREKCKIYPMWHKLTSDASSKWEFREFSTYYIKFDEVTIQHTDGFTYKFNIRKSKYRNYGYNFYPIRVAMELTSKKIAYRGSAYTIDECFDMKLRRISDSTLVTGITTIDTVKTEMHIWYNNDPRKDRFWNNGVPNNKWYIPWIQGSCYFIVISNNKTIDFKTSSEGGEWYIEEGCVIENFIMDRAPVKVSSNLNIRFGDIIKTGDIVINSMTYQGEKDPISLYTSGKNLIKENLSNLPEYKDSSLELFVEIIDPKMSADYDAAANFENGKVIDNKIYVPVSVAYSVATKSIPEIPLNNRDVGIYVAQTHKGVKGNGSDSENPIAISTISNYIQSDEYYNSILSENTESKKSTISHYIAVKEAFTDPVVLPTNIRLTGNSLNNPTFSVTDAKFNSLNVPSIVDSVFYPHLKGNIKEVMVSDLNMQQRTSIDSILVTNSMYLDSTVNANRSTFALKIPPTRAGNKMTNCIIWVNNNTSNFAIPSPDSCINCASNSRNWLLNEKGIKVFAPGYFVNGDKSGIKNLILSEDNMNKYGPLFVDPNADDYRLQEKSILINRGVSL